MSTDNNANKRRRTSNASARADPAPSSAALPASIADEEGETGGPEILVPKLDEIPKLLVEGMQASDEDTVAAAMDALHDLLITSANNPNGKKNRLEARQIGGVAFVVAAMRKWQRNAVIQREGCGCIASFAYNSDSQTSCSIVTIGGIEAVVNALRLFPANLATQKYGVVAFGNTFHEPAAVTLGGDRFVTDIDGVQMVLKAVKKFPNDDQIKHGVCSIFASLAAEERFRDVMTNAGVVVAVAGILKNTDDAVTKTYATRFMKRMYGA